MFFGEKRVSNTRKEIPDNLEQAAKNLVDYILQIYGTEEEKRNHNAQFAIMMKAIEEKYKTPWFNYYGVASVEKCFHYFSRTRSEEIQHTKQKIDAILSGLLAEDEKPLFIFQALVEFLGKEKSGCDITSANTFLLNYLITQSNLYVPLEESVILKNFQSSVKTKILIEFRLSLKNLFVKEANQVIKSYQSVQKPS